jgi:hypothetical protein
MFACLCLAASLAGAEQIINQSFTGDATPTGWVVQGTTGTSHTTVGTALSNTHFYGAAGTQNYLQLTNNNLWQRASAYYTAATLDSRDFTVTANLYLGGGRDHGDGLTLSFIDARTISSTTQLLGGYGQWEGSPQGTAGGSIQGYVPGVQGFNFEFDHFMNPGEPAKTYTGLVNANDWRHYGSTIHDFTSDSTFYYNTGWERVQLRAWDGRMYFSWNYNGTTQAYDNSYDFALPDDYGSYEAYFGITAGTGGVRSDQWVSDVTLNDSGAGVPEPGSLVLYGLVALGLPWLRRRQRTGALNSL